MADLIHSLERTIVICATKSTVFRFFTDSKRFADWWGEGSSIEGRVGGALLIRFSNEILVTGEVLEMKLPERIVFTYGYQSGTPFPPDESRVTITLQDHPDGTQLMLRHDFADATARDHHIQGWRYQLALFANVASRDQHSNVLNLLDAYFDLWNTSDAPARLEKMKSLFESDATFKDKHSCTLGMDDLNAHLAAYQQFMPGMKIARDGDAKECQGTVMVRWIANKADGSRMASGQNVFTLSPPGRIRQITGFWD